MKFTTFTNGCAGKVLTAVLCVLLGVVLTLGGIAGGGYFLLTKKGMLLKAEKLAVGKGIALDFDDTIAQGTFLDWGKSLVGVFQNVGGSTIGEIESLVGMPVISNILNEMLGIDQAIIKQATISTVGETISAKLTMNNAKEKFGISFPDMPLFSDEEFLAKPLGEAFASIDSYPLNKLINITEDAHQALKEIQDLKVNELGGKATSDRINAMFLGQLVTINETSSKTLKALKDCTIASFYQYDESGEQLLDEQGKYIYAVKTVTVTEGGETTEVEMPMQGISDKLKELQLAEVIDITESSHAVLRKMRAPTQEEINDGKEGLFGTENLLVDELGGSKFTEIVDNMTIGELIAVTPESEPILQALEFTKINGLNAKMQNLQLNEIFKPASLKTGALSLIDATTKLPDIPLAMTNAMQNENIITLKKKGVIAEDKFANIANMQKRQQSFVYNSTMGELLKGMIDFMADPISGMAPNYHYVQTENVTIDTDAFSSLSDFVEAYSQYANIRAADGSDDVIPAITVTVGGAGSTDYESFYNEADGCYYIPLFSLTTETGIIFEYADHTEAGVKLAIMDKTVDGGDVFYTLSKHQYGYYFAPSGYRLEALQVEPDAIVFVTLL